MPATVREAQFGRTFPVVLSSEPARVIGRITPATPYGSDGQACWYCGRDRIEDDYHPYCGASCAVNAETA